MAVTDPVADNVEQSTTTDPSATTNPAQEPLLGRAEAEATRRRRVNLAFQIGRNIKRLHQVVDPHARDYYDDADDDADAYSDNDDDAYDDYHDDDVEDGVQDDQDVEDVHDDDEPYDEQEQTSGADSTATHAKDSTHQDASQQDSTLATDLARAGVQGAAKDLQTGRLRFDAERLPPPGAAQQAASNASAAPQQRAVATTPGVAVAGQQPQQTTRATPVPLDAGKSSVGTNVRAAPAATDPAVKPAVAPVPATQPAPTATKPSPVSTGPAAAASPPQKPNPLAPTPAAPYGYRIVKARMPDGTIKQVKRPIKAEEQKSSAGLHTPADAAKAAPPAAVMSAGAMPAVTTPAQEAATSTPAPSVTPVARTPKLENDESKKNLVQTSEKEIPADASTDVPQAPKPPIIPVRAHTSRSGKVMQIVSWTIMIMFPLLFLGLGIATLVMRNHLVPTPNTLSQTINVSISIWPIVFAAILAQTLKAYAAWKVERGIPLVTLEQLISSHSVGAAVKQPFLLRKFNFISIALIILWALSPLSGQALLRMVKPTDVERHIDGTVQYFQLQTFPDAESEFVLGTNYSNFGGVDPNLYLMQSVYTSLMLGSNTTRLSSQDPWSNPRIPVYQEHYAEGADWTYSSLLGVPISMPPISSKNTSQDARDLGWSFNIVTSYFTLKCSDMTVLNLTNDTATRLGFELQQESSLYFSADNNTLVFEVEGDNETAPIKQYGPGINGTIHFGSYDATWKQNSSTDPVSEHNQIFYSECPYDQVLVNTTMSCYGIGNGAVCDATDQKLVPSTWRDFQPLGASFAAAMRQYSGTNGFTETEKYVYNADYADKATNDDTTLKAWPGFAGVKGEQVSRGLGQLVNTLWMAGHKTNFFLGGSFAAHFANEALVTHHPVTWTAGASAARSLGLTEKRYVVSAAWVTVLLACSVVLLAAAVAAAWLEVRTVGPDFLGFASTAVRKGVRLPPRINALSARERMQALQECEVLLQDVRPAAPVGRIALGVREEGSVALVRDRHYR